MADVVQKVITVFYSYASSPRDDALRVQLEKHLAGLQRSGLIEGWSRREVIAGKEQQQDIDEHLEHASVILLLVSPDFVASDYCYGSEMLRAMERHQAGSARVIPILLRPVYLENAPFAHLASLPNNGRPISMWRNRDAAFADVVRDVSASIRELLTSSHATTNAYDHASYFVHNGLSYFSALDTYLDAQGRAFREDAELGRLYIPKKEYFASIETTLDTKHRALIVGRAAAGKTGLALAVAKYLQAEAGYIVGYKDVKHAVAGDGRMWYSIAREHDRPNVLYVLDNCHLAPGEVNEFCSQWLEQPPLHAQCLLIARTGYVEEQVEENGYLHTFARDERVEVHAKDIYLQVIAQYISTLHERRTRYEELLQSDDAAKLEKQYAHNLVIVRECLELWKALGPEHLLSEVSKEDLYRALAAKYFTQYGTALAKLCTLQRYEISAHISYVEHQLARHEVARLLQERLLTGTIVSGYGQLYDLTLHPTEARELFLAHVFQQYGSLKQDNINAIVIVSLKEYLGAKPANYLNVYDSLSRQRHEDILRQLLTDRDLQAITMSQFTKERIIEAIRYAYRVARVNQAYAQPLVERIVLVAGVRGITPQLQRLPFEELALLLEFLRFLHADLAQQVVAMLDVSQVAQRADVESTQNLFRLLKSLRSLSSAHMQALLTTIPVDILASKMTVRNFQGIVDQLKTYGYSLVQLQTVVATLDMQQFALQSERISLQSLCWTLNELEKVSMPQAQQLLRSISPWMLAMKASSSNLGSVDQLIQLMQRLGYKSKEMSEFIDNLDIEQVTQAAKAANLRRIASFLRSIKNVAPATASHILETLPATELASLTRAHRVTLDDLEQLRKAIPKALWTAFLRACLPEDIAAIFQRTSLGAIGTFLRYQYGSRTVQAAYALFQEQFLQEQLATTTLEEMGEFLDRTQAIRQNGKSIASIAIGGFLSTDITQRVAHTSMRQYALLLHHIRSIESTYLPRLLAPLRQDSVLQTALAVSDINDIQLLVFNIANIDTGYLPYLHQALVTANVTEKLDQASLHNIGLFLWNIYKYLDAALAQTYCDYLDEHFGTPKYAVASPEDLCFFLWNLASISSAATLQTFDAPLIQQRVREGWPEAVGWSLVLQGIIASVHGNSYRNERFLFSRERHRDALLAWFAVPNAGRNPYYAALALQGLRTQSDEVALMFVQGSTSLKAVYASLVSARESAITPRSIRLIEETIRWLYRLLETS